jgi:hypothetical protein
VELLGESVLRVSAPGSLLEKDGGVGSSTVTGFNELAATVPGKRITDLQVSKYKDLRGRHGQEAAAAKTGISVASARRLE